jgi:hypothetical protein
MQGQHWANKLLLLVQEHQSGGFVALGRGREAHHVSEHDG